MKIDPAMRRVLDQYETRLDAERPKMRQAVEAGTFGAVIDDFLLPVGPASGMLINLLARSLTAPTILELGTSYGYSGIWLADAARATGGRLVTMELSEKKSAYARQMSEEAGLAEFVDFKVGDAVTLIGTLEQRIDFVLVDLWKDLYLPCLEAFYPKLNPGAILVSDNMIEPASAAADVARYKMALRALPKMTSILVPVGSGLEISRFNA